MARRYLIYENGDFVERFARPKSGGVADAEEIPELGPDGILDPTILGASTTGPSIVLMTLPTGRIAQDVMPVGLGLDASSIVTSEGVTAGNLVNIHMVGSDFLVRRADAAAGRAAHGYVVDSFVQGEMALVFREGTNDQVSGLTGVRLFLSATVPGAVTSVPPTGAGVIVQPVGTAHSTSAFYFLQGRATILAA